MQNPKVYIQLKDSSAALLDKYEQCCLQPGEYHAIKIQLLAESGRLSEALAEASKAIADPDIAADFLGVFVRLAAANGDDATAAAIKQLRSLQQQQQQHWICCCSGAWRLLVPRTESFLTQQQLQELKTLLLELRPSLSAAAASPDASARSLRTLLTIDKCLLEFAAVAIEVLLRLDRAEEAARKEDGTQEQDPWLRRRFLFEALAWIDAEQQQQQQQQQQFAACMHVYMYACRD
ncbi:hypothetical protein, conserved [Eimeria maxima]|uniref:Uncharacterized protein n=1 Tax=Eimeria maxima TaxID=5804 RepID=U6M818_EIMMA|nr:hypothetical protein, conserved [Eimeria maxima]CDJ60166.1 hypothetical protein, conserved [Eimeria maxima]